MQNKRGTRAVVYVRASLDTTGKAESVARQEEACRALALARGWEVVAVLSDNSISAYGEKDRPGWRRVLSMMEAREVDVVVAWHVDRLTRSMTDLEALILRAEEAGVGVATATGDIDLTTDAGRMVARILAAVARAEVERKAARQKLANSSRARAGKPHVAGARAFGYERDGETVVEEEAAAIKDGARRFLAGESMASIARDWEARGLESARAGQSKKGAGWSPSGVRNVLRNPRYAGRRIYNGEDVGAGAWEPILTLEDSLAIRAKLLEPERRKGRGPSKGREATTLLSALARCGVCGGNMSASVSRGVHTYKCRAGSCVSVARGPVDEWVTDHLLAWVSDPGVWAQLVEAAAVADGTTETPEARARATVLETRERLDELADYYAKGVIDGSQLGTASATLRAALADAEAVLASSGKGAAVEGLVGRADPRGAWERMTLVEQRAAVAAVFPELTFQKFPVARKGRGAREWTPEALAGVVSLGGV